MSENLKNLFVFVPSNAVTDFTSKHVGDNKSSDEYFNKVSFLSGSGQLAARGELFGMSKDFADKIGLIDEITTSNTLMTYITSIKNSVATLNGGTNVENSVDKKIQTAINTVVAGAPEAYDTIKEIADWIKGIQGEQGTAAAVASTLAKVTPLENALGGYTVDGNGTYTYTGSYLFAHNAAEDAVNGLTLTDSAQSGKYISQITLSNGTFTVTRADLPTLAVNSTAGNANQYISALSVSGHTITATYSNLPTLSIADGSSNYLTVNNHIIGVTVSTISDTTGITATTSGNNTTYSTTTEANIGTGLITAAAVYNRIHSTEDYVASALTTLDARIATVVAGATGDLDSQITITDSNGYGSVKIVQENGLLVSSGTVQSATHTAALTINKSAILTDASSTIDSTTTGTGANAYIQVHVTQENYKVTGVTVDFDPWEIYTPQS